MNDVFFDELGIRAPDHFLGVGSGSHAEQTGRVMTAFEPLLDELPPGHRRGRRRRQLHAGVRPGRRQGRAAVAHVEAGLRSRDWAMPEEVNRVVTDRVSDYLLAPSPDAVENLRAEGYRDDQIHLVGNVMIDTLLANLDRARASDILGRLGLATGEYGLVTLHRPANVDDPEVLAGLLEALGEIAGSCPLVLPVHPRTAGRLADAAPRRASDSCRPPATWTSSPFRPPPAWCSPTPAACRRRPPRWASRA